MKFKIGLFLIALAIIGTLAFQSQDFDNIITRRLTVRNAATFQVAPTFSAGVTLTDGALTLDGVAQSGPVTFGSASVISGGRIAHGLGTTPTSIIITPFQAAADGTFTQTLSISATNATSFTVNISTGSVTTTVAYWMAGK